MVQEFKFFSIFTIMILSLTHCASDRTQNGTRYNNLYHEPSIEKVHIAPPPLPCHKMPDNRIHQIHNKPTFEQVINGNLPPPCDCLSEKLNKYHSKSIK